MKKMTMGSKMAIANASCNKQGKHGDKACVEKVAHGIAKTHRIVKGSARKKGK